MRVLRRRQRILRTRTGSWKRRWRDVETGADGAPVWFTTWCGPFHMGMIPFNLPWGPARVLGDVYSAASPFGKSGNAPSFLRAIRWKEASWSQCVTGSALRVDTLAVSHPPPSLAFSCLRDIAPRAFRDEKFNATFSKPATWSRTISPGSLCRNIRESFPWINFL